MDQGSSGATNDMQPSSYLRQCRGKVNFHSIEKAQREAKFLHKKFKAKFNAYPCPHCHGFHVGGDRSQAGAIRRAKRRGTFVGDEALGRLTLGVE